VLWTSLVIKQFCMFHVMSAYYKMIERRKLFLLLIVEKDGSMKKWTGIEISKNDVKYDIWSLIRCSNVRLYAFPL